MLAAWLLSFDHNLAKSKLLLFCFLNVSVTRPWGGRSGHNNRFDFDQPEALFKVANIARVKSL